MPVHKLAVRRVLACRPKHQNTQWIGKLASEDFIPLNIPLLEINAPSDPRVLRDIQTCILNVDQYESIIFVSQNAVKHFFDWLDKFWAELVQGWELIGVGEATSIALEQKCLAFGGTTYAKVLGGKNAMNSEALLEMPELLEVDNKKILICRGVGGRARLGDELEQRGARVTYCELYNRERPKNACDKLAHAKIDATTDCLAFFSNETMANFLYCMKNKSQQTNTSFLDARVVVPGERVAAHAKQAGFKQIYVAKNATQDAMLSTINLAYQH